MSRPTLDRKKLTIVCSSAKSDEILDIYSTSPHWSQPTVSHQAYYGSKNRRAFYQLAEREIGRAARYGKAFTVAYCDVDDFKQGNDCYGHAAGADDLLYTATRASQNRA